MASTTLQCPQLLAAPHWRVVDCISDLHLQTGEPATFDAWAHYLHETPADAVLMLGDLFEVWVGDDAADEPDSFEARCAQVLQSAARHRALYFMPGNRDFLVGSQFLKRAQVTLLDDPTVLQWGHQRWLLSHGDALCLEDVDYLRFRDQVRSSAWQQQFLAQPLQARRALARQIRNASESRKQTGAPYADVDADAARAPCAGRQVERTPRPLQDQAAQRGLSAVLRSSGRRTHRGGGRCRQAGAQRSLLSGGTTLNARGTGVAPTRRTPLLTTACLPISRAWCRTL